MENEIAEAMSKKSSEELIKILTIEKLNYSPLGLKAAEHELSTRNLDPQYIAETKQQLTGESYKDLRQDTELALHQYAVELFGQGKKSYEVRHIFSMGGLDQSSITKILGQIEFQNQVAKKEKAKKEMLYGALWAGGGAIATIINIGYIFWGAMIFGAYQFFKGLYDYHSIKIVDETAPNSSLDSVI